MLINVCMSEAGYRNASSIQTLQNLWNRARVMKIFRCEECGTYTRRVSIEIPLWIKAKINELGEFWLDDPDFELPWDRKVHEPIDIDACCEECSGELELIDIDECPHVWEKTYGAWNRDARRCSLCGMKQKGEIIR